MDNMNYENEKTAQWASKIWRDAITKYPDLVKSFHPRYNSDYVEIISHLDVLPMYGSGQKKSDKSNSSLRSFLEDLGKRSEVAHGNFTVDELYSLGFSNPVRTNQIELECKSQAWLIRSLLKEDQEGYKKLKAQLKASEVSFLASEFILFRKGDEHRYRIDVVGLGPEEIYIFEVKRPVHPSGNAGEQVNIYKQYYEKKDAFYTMQSRYSEIDIEQLKKKKVVGCTANGFGSKAELHKV